LRDDANHVVVVVNDRNMLAHAFGKWQYQINQHAVLPAFSAASQRDLLFRSLLIASREYPLDFLKLQKHLIESYYRHVFGCVSEKFKGFLLGPLNSTSPRNDNALNCAGMHIRHACFIPPSAQSSFHA
jgi:hypothetical protein